jgi:hypothetical protein
LAELILAAVNTRKAELCAIIERALTARTREALDELLVQGSAGEDEPVPAKTAAYKLTLLKKLSQSTKPSKIRETITDLLVVQGLYRDFLPILCALDLNHEGIRYYALNGRISTFLLPLITGPFGAINFWTQPVRPLWQP